MANNHFVGSASAVLLVGIVVAVAFAHQAYLELCVCVVNSLGRAAASLALSLSFGPALDLLDGNRWPRVRPVMLWLQLLAFLAGIFFVVQHIFFALEIA